MFVKEMGESEGKREKGRAVRSKYCDIWCSRGGSSEGCLVGCDNL
jgi:hypothetical protein